MLDDFVKTVFAGPMRAASTWMKDHATLAWVLCCVLLLWMIVPKFFDAFDVWYARLLTPLAKFFRFQSLVRAATKYDVRGHVNRCVYALAKQLPDGWISDLEIRWVNNATREQFFDNNRIVVRVRPLKEQNHNFVTVLHLFLKQALFAKVRHLIPENQRAAAVLYFGDRIAAARGEATLQAYGECVFEPAIDGKKKILEYFQRYSHLDSKGFFTGPYVREVQHVAEEVRATRFRDNMSVEMNAALTHLEEFLAAYDKSQADRVPMASSVWTRDGIITKYALLLVAHPNKALADETGAGYIARAQQQYNQGVRRLYVLGTSGERDFAEKVIHAIANRTPYKIEQEFALYRDYRGKAGGIGALFLCGDLNEAT